MFIVINIHFSVYNILMWSTLNIHCLILLFCQFCLNPFALANQNKIPIDQAEQELIQIMELIQEQKIDIALAKSNQLLAKYPNFKLLKALSADLLYSQFNQINQPFSTIKNPQNQTKLLSEAKARIESIQASGQLHQHHLPDLLKYIDNSTAYFFIIDYSKSRLYLFKNIANKLPELIVDHYVTMGENGFKKELSGDKKSPLGIYHVTSFLNDTELPELYGWGAFPINYPNAWDKRNKRTGYGIWLHGVPRNTYSRPPQDSRGCLVISNDFLINLSSYLKINTPVILTQSIKWIPKKKYQQKRSAYKKGIYKWKAAFENKNLEQYLKFYSKSFNNGKNNYQSWKEHIQQLFSNTQEVNIQTEQLTIFKYPGEMNMLAVSFYQRFNGINHINNGYKQQYWKKETDGNWRIIHENLVN
jgi:murein L,D-transpeptidase YafK